MNNEEIWKCVRFANEWLDRESLPVQDPRILRCFKIAEELGEVTAAIVGVTGQNPRKGVTHTWSEVQEELCDVILSAMVALDCVSEEAQEVFEKHVQKRHDRTLGLIQ